MITYYYFQIFLIAQIHVAKGKLKVDLLIMIFK